MSAYLAEHLPHLQSLHAQLALDSSALAADEAKIEAAIRGAVTGLLRDREAEVDAWRDAIAGEKRKVVCIHRALGDGSRNIPKRDSEINEPLPVQYEGVISQRKALEKTYKERLEHIERQHAMLDQLATLLGSPFEPSKPLQIIASSSAAPLPPTTAPRRGSHLHRITSTTVGSRRSGSMIPPPSSNGIGSECLETETSWFDVGPSIIEAVDTAVQSALEERIKRIANLARNLIDLRILHGELLLPPVPISYPHHFPIGLLPPKSMEEIPGAHGSFEKLLSRIITQKVEGAEINGNGNVVEEGGEGEGEEGEDEEGEGRLKIIILQALEDVEPEVGLIRWTEEVLNLWDEERLRREKRIQELFDQLEPLWSRLEIEQDQLDLFIQMNMGSSEASIKAYEMELERCLELRKSSLSSFMVGARKEIEMLWAELMMSEDEKGDFGAFIDDNYTEELLKEHEEEALRLRSEIESKATLLPKVREWHTLVADEEELETSMSDPNRFNRRGGALLREEKLRKRVAVLKPKVEGELLHSIPIWEEANGRPFMVQGIRVVDKIYEEMEAKEAAKEAKKRARQGLGPPPVKALAPSRTVKPTPSASTRSQPASTMQRKRQGGPQPTPLAGYGNVTKKPRVGGNSSIPSHASSRNITTGSTVNKSRNPSQPTRTFQRDPSSSPTYQGRIQKPTTNHTNGMRAISQPTNGLRIPSHSQPGVPSKISTSAMAGPSGLPSLNLMGLAKANGRRPRRESFKPRQSLAGGLLMARRRESWVGEEMVEEEGEDVF